MKRLLAIALFTATSLCHAQAAAPSNPAKKELVQKILTIQQPAIDNMARTVAEGPARQMMAAAEVGMRQVPQEKRKAASEQIESSLRKYLDEALPLAKERATKVAQSSLGPMLEEKFSEEELRQLMGVLDAPAYKKFQQALPELSSSFIQKLVADVQPPLEPKLTALEKRVAEALGVPTQAASAPKAGKPAASAASKPAKK